MLATKQQTYRRLNHHNHNCCIEYHLASENVYYTMMAMRAVEHEYRVANLLRFVTFELLQYSHLQSQ